MDLTETWLKTNSAHFTTVRNIDIHYTVKAVLKILDSHSSPSNLREILDQTYNGLKAATLFGPPLCRH